MEFPEKLKNMRDSIAGYIPVADENKENVANVLGTAVMVVGAYGVYKLISNNRSRSKVSNMVKNFSRSISGNLFGKRRRRRSRKGSKKQKKIRRSRH